jgi:CubicO group peptidase (beta-lactamase class C family)
MSPRSPQVLANRDIARPYWTDRSGARSDFTTTPYFGFVRGPDSGAYSTVTDLLRFAIALRTGRLVPPAFTSLVTSGMVPIPPSGTSQWLTAYGFEDYIIGDRRAFGHPGNGPGTATNLDIYPDQDWVSVILSNYDTTIDPIIQMERRLG